MSISIHRWLPLGLGLGSQLLLESCKARSDFERKLSLQLINHEDQKAAWNQLPLENSQRSWLLQASFPHMGHAHIQRVLSYAGEMGVLWSLCRWQTERGIDLRILKVSLSTLSLVRLMGGAFADSGALHKSHFSYFPRKLGESIEAIEKPLLRPLYFAGLYVYGHELGKGALPRWKKELLTLSCSVYIIGRSVRAFVQRKAPSIVERVAALGTVLVDFTKSGKEKDASRQEELRYLKSYIPSALHRDLSNISFEEKKFLL